MPSSGADPYQFPPSHGNRSDFQNYSETPKIRDEKNPEHFLREHVPGPY